jgi:hypothetical protein
VSVYRYAAHLSRCECLVYLFSGVANPSRLYGAGHCCYRSRSDVGLAGTSGRNYKTSAFIYQKLDGVLLIRSECHKISAR